MKEHKSYLNEYEDIDEAIDSWGMDEVFESIGLNSEEPGDCGDGDTILIGIDPSKMKDDETLREFKEHIVSKLLEFGLEVDVKDLQFVTGGQGPDGYTFIDSWG